MLAVKHVLPNRIKHSVRLLLASLVKNARVHSNLPIFDHEGGVSNTVQELQYDSSCHVLRNESLIPGSGSCGIIFHGQLALGVRHTTMGNMLHQALTTPRLDTRTN